MSVRSFTHRQLADAPNFGFVGRISDVQTNTTKFVCLVIGAAANGKIRSPISLRAILR